MLAFESYSLEPTGRLLESVSDYRSRWMMISRKRTGSGLQGDSSLNMGSLAINTQGTPLLVTQVLQPLSEICRISMGNIMYIWTCLWTSFLVIGKK